MSTVTRRVAVVITALLGAHPIVFVVSAVFAMIIVVAMIVGPGWLPSALLGVAAAILIIAGMITGPVC